MRRSDLEHLIRAAGRIAGERELVIVGSQSVLGQFPDVHAEAWRQSPIRRRDSRDCISRRSSAIR